MTKQQSQEEFTNNAYEKSKGGFAINKGRVIALILFILIILAGSIYGIYFLLQGDAQTTSHIRDIFIIGLALESFVIGIALIVLVIQLALLINLIQNEIKPMIYSTKETINTLRGTTAFISEHAVRPVISVSSYLAGAKKFFQIIGILRNKK